MLLLRFEWDERKNRENRRKHGVSFDEAQTVFYDDNAIEFYDDEHSGWENRFLLLGVRSRIMKKEYDLNKMKSRRNPYAKRLKKQLTIRMGMDIIEHFKHMAEETGIPYQNLINLYLRDCVQSGRKLHMKWAS
jgi:uncharacterized protein (DUF4415 family)